MASRAQLILIGALLVPAPALAAGKFAPPAGCEVFVTVQHHRCQVSNHYRCAGEAPGDQWATYSDSEGPYFLARIDAETRWLESFDLVTGQGDRLGDQADPASFSTLLSAGRDDYDFATVETSGAAIGEVRRYAGFDRLTGDRVVIDDVPLERTSFEIVAHDGDGNELWRRSGNQLVHREWRIFFADREEFTNSFGDRDSSLETPIRFDFPGDAGFLADKPEYDCEMMMTEAAPAAPRPTDGEHQP